MSEPQEIESMATQAAEAQQAAAREALDAVAVAEEIAYATGSE